MMSKLDDMINADRKKTYKNISFFLLSSSSKSSIGQICYSDIYYLSGDFIKGMNKWFYYLIFIFIQKENWLRKKGDLEFFWNFSFLFNEQIFFFSDFFL